MKAAVWYAAEDVRVTDVPDPKEPGPGEVTVQVEWCGICGSDFHEYLHGPITIPVDEPHPLTGHKAPMILGHEFSGTVVAVSPDVAGLAIGSRVVPDACQACWQCYWCKRMQYNICEKGALTGLAAPGGLAEFVNVPAYTCYEMPGDLTFEQGALVEPMAVGFHAVRKAPVVAGDTVAIVGAGPIGIACLESAIAAGAVQVIVLETIGGRREMSRELGAASVIDPTATDAVAAVHELTGGIGADVVFECVGVSPSDQLAIDITRRGGTTVMVGIFGAPSTIDWFTVVTQEKRIIGSVTYNGEFEPVMEMIAGSRLNVAPLISKKVALTDVVKSGFEFIGANKADVMKVLVTPRGLVP